MEAHTTKDSSLRCLERATRRAPIHYPRENYSDPVGKMLSYSCEQIEQGDYNAFFYYPSQQERYLGQVSGLNQCQSMAGNYAVNEEVVGADWGYICCMIAHGIQSQRGSPTHSTVF